MRVLICGSRDWNLPVKIAARMAQLPKDAVVVQGGARGPDRIAATYAKGLGHEVEEWPAYWERFGRRAGIERNIDMLDSGVGLVIAFWDGKSRGTKFTIDEADRRRIPVEVHNPQGPVDYHSPPIYEDSSP